jgi:hypothetical protein
VGGVVGGRSSRVRRDGRPAISNAIAIAVAIIIVLAGLATFAYMGNVSTGYLGKALPEKLRQEGERGSELLRIYIWSRNHTLEGEPVITILNSWGKDSEIDVLMVANRTGHVVNVLALGPPMKIPASTAVEIRPSDLGLPYRTFGDLIQNIGGILAHTVLGNSFGSTWGMPREEYVFGSIATTAITNVTTTAWVVTGFTSVQEGTTISLYTTLSYPPEWNGNALIIAYDHLGGAGCGDKRPCSEPECINNVCNYYDYCKNIGSTRGDEKPKMPGYFCDVCGPAVETAPRFSWYLAMNPLRIDRFYGRYDRDCESSGCKSCLCSVGCCWKPLWECSESWVLKNVTLSAVEPGVISYVTTYQVSGSGQAVAGWEQLGGKITFSTYLVPTGYNTFAGWGAQPGYYCNPKWLTYTTTYLATGVSLQPVTVTGTTTITVTRTLNSPIEAVTHTVTGWKPVTTTAAYEDKNRIYTYTVTASGVYWNPWTRVCVTSTYGRYVGAVYDMPPYTFTTTTTHTIVLSAWRSITQPYAPQNPQYSQYEEGDRPGAYGPAPHLYFKLIYPVYIIHRYYEKAGCSCQSYSPPPGGGAVSPPPPSNSTGVQICDVAVIRDKQGNYNSTIINCR